MESSRTGWRISALLAILVLSFCMLSIAVAQESTGRILGTVTDESGAVIPDARVAVTGPNLPQGLETISDGSGNYTVFNVPVGTYVVTVGKTGFNTVRQVNVQVNLGSQVNYNPKLTVGQVTQVVEVQDSAISLDTTSAR